VSPSRDCNPVISFCYIRQLSRRVNGGRV
jgi:hypothetical protein